MNQKISKKTRYKSYVFGDFDKDGVPNIDDKYPADPKKKDTVQEVMLSDELKKIREHNLNYKNLLKVVKKRYGKGRKIKFRIKGTHSTIGKLRRKHIHQVQDILGITILCKNKKEIKRIAQDIHRNFYVISDKNYYVKSKRGNKYYKARHLIVRIRGKPAEIQLKTKKHYQLHQSTHPIYKKYGKIPSKKYKKLLRLSKRIEREEV
jgi:ppGpp synthetase/RelA/SpoT-type nucleotidyltranferase